MLKRIYFLSLFLSILGFTSVAAETAETNQTVTFYTPYSRIVVAPGETVNYSIDVINDTNQNQQFDLSVSGLYSGWDYELKTGSYTVKELSVLHNAKKTLTLKVVVPLKVNKGNHSFKLMANGKTVLPLVIEVSKQGTYETDFSIDQPSMEGHSKSTFSYRAKLRNRTGEKQLYSLQAETPRGWETTFKVHGKQVASVNVNENATEDIMISVKPSSTVDAGTYKIPVHAVSNSTSAKIELEAVISGSYDLELTTPTGLLSTKITAGESTNIDLVVRNTGSAELKNVNFSVQKPSGWDVTFEPKKIDHLKAGKVAQATATIKASKKAIAGDYMTKITARAPEATANSSIRVAVRASMLLGWIGIVIILCALGSIIYLFRKYGRR